MSKAMIGVWALLVFLFSAIPVRAGDVHVLALQGTVMAVQHARAVPVQEGDTLRAGVEVQVAKGASLAVLLENNQIKSIIGPADWTIPDKNADGETGVTDKLADLLLKRKGGKGSRQLAVRAGDDEGMALPLLVHPPPFDELRLVEDNPLLEWVPMGGVERYRVRLRTNGGNPLVHETERHAVPFETVAGGPMEPGVTYRWTVEPVGLNTSSVEVRFTLLSDEERRTLGDEIQTLRDVADPLLRNRLVARLFFQRGLYGELRKMVQSLGNEAIEPEIRQVLRHRYLTSQGVSAIHTWVE
ncbi:hypothetical protein GF324_09310 [bacterium]|nr:hypothetical protein [bacterium]